LISARTRTTGLRKTGLQASSAPVDNALPRREKRTAKSQLVGGSDI